MVPKAAGCPDVVTGGGPTVAVRCPAHPVARALIASRRRAGRRPERQPLRRTVADAADHVLKGLDGRIDVVLDGGPCPGGIESTVVDVTGPVGPAAAAGADHGGAARSGRRAGWRSARPPAAGPLPSPGMLARHYAPRTPLEWPRRRRRPIPGRTYETAGLKVARLTLAGTPAAVAARLYAELHVLDAGGYDRIIAVLPPDADEWRAVRDRLTRAAAE